MSGLAAGLALGAGVQAAQNAAAQAQAAASGAAASAQAAVTQAKDKAMSFEDQLQKERGKKELTGEGNVESPKAAKTAEEGDEDYIGGIAYGQAVNGYVQQIVKGKASYPDLVRQLVQFASNPLDKKLAKKGLPVLRDLSLFHLEPHLFDHFAKLLQHPDPKVVRLAYVFLNNLAMTDASVNVSNSAISALQQDLSGPVLARRILAIRTLARIAPNDVVEASLVPALTSLLQKVAAFDESEAPVKKRKGFFGGSKNYQLERNFLQYASLSAVRHRVPLGAGMFDHVVRGIQSPDRVAARHAVAMMVRYCSQSPKVVGETMRPHLPHIGTKRANYADTFARVYLAQICQIIASAEPNDVDRGLRTDFHQALSQLVLDSRDRVVFEAISGLASLPWEALASGVIRVTTDAGAQTSPLLPEILIRLSTALSATSQPLVHAACRVTAKLAEAYMTAAQDGALQDSTVPLHSLTQPLRRILQHKNDYVRCRALHALIWMTSHDNTAELDEMVSAELGTSDLPVQLVNDLLEALHRRVMVTSSLAPLLLSMTVKWCTLVPSKANTRLILDTWDTIMQFGPGHRTYVLQTVFKVLDNSGTQDTHKALERIHHGAFWFLGEHANYLANEELARYTPATAPPPDTPTSETVTTPRWTSRLKQGVRDSAESLRSSIASITSRQSSITSAASTGTVSGISTASTDAVPMTASTDEGSRAVLANITPAIRSILLRLQQGAMFASWETRVLCTQALIKIALRSSDPVRIQTYEFLAMVARDRGACLQAVAVPALALLDQLLSARQQFILQLRERAQLTEAESRLLWQQHVSLVQQVRTHCAVREDYLPLGPESLRPLQEHYNKFVQNQGSAAQAVAGV